jgi:hypothetical protein
VVNAVEIASNRFFKLFKILYSIEKNKLLGKQHKHTSRRRKTYKCNLSRSAEICMADGTVTLLDSLANSSSRFHILNTPPGPDCL